MNADTVLPEELVAAARRPVRPIGGTMGWFGSILRAVRKNSISGATIGFQPFCR